MRDVGPPIDDAALDEFQRQHAVIFPDAYRAFLRKWNGGKPVQSLFAIPGEGRDSIRRFFSVGDVDRWASLARTLRMFSSRIPAGAIPIADDSFGNLLLICSTGDHEYPIAFWDHERDDEPEGITVVAKSLETFLETLDDEPDDDEHRSDSH